MCSERRALWVLVLLLVSCTRTGLDGSFAPKLASVLPRGGLAAEPVTIEIHGSHFYLRPSRDLRQRHASIDAQFSAWLGSTALENVSRIDTNTLRATVPAGLPLGKYRLTVEDPFGQRVTLDAAYTVTDQPPAKLSATLDVSALELDLGMTAQVHAVVSNVGGSDAEAVAPTLNVSGAQLTLQSSPSPASIAPGQSAQFVWTVQAASLGAVQVTLAGAGEDAITGVALPVSAPGLALDVKRGPVLSLTASASPLQVSVGDALTVEATVTNTGDLTAQAVAPGTPSFSLALLSVTGATLSANLAPGESRTYSIALQADGAGTVDGTLTASGIDALSGRTVEASASLTALTLQRPAQLRASLTAPATVSNGQSATVRLLVANDGEALARGVQPSLSVSGPGGLTVLNSPSPVDLAGGASAPLDFTVQATARGAVTLQAGAIAEDGNDSATVSSSTTGTLTVQSPAALSASLSAPVSVGPSQPFDVTLQVSDTGDTGASGVTPTLTIGGTGAVTLVSGPSPASSAVPGGGSVTFRWTFTGSATGAVQFTASAAGSDAALGSPVASAQVSATTQVDTSPLTATLVYADPFGDQSPFAFVFTYAGELYVGPNKTGTQLLHSRADGSFGQSSSLSIRADTVGSRSANKAAGPYPSLGYTGCTLDTLQCGPDDENGRGFVFGGAMGSTSWLALGGGHGSSGDRYVYLSPNTTSPLDTFYADLSAFTVGGTSALTAGHFFSGRLYLGFSGGDGERPQLAALQTMPSAPGLNAVLGTDVIDLVGKSLPGVGGSSSPSMIDVISDFAGALYLGNNGGWVRSIGSIPGPNSSSAPTFRDVTPSTAAYAAKSSITTNKVDDLEPADRALPAFATFGGRLFAIRNTTSGPQLFGCTPTDTRDGAAQCAPGDWMLVAPNTSGDAQLTQFDDPGNAAATILLATSKHLYVGFNNVGGARLLRTGNANPGATDFQSLTLPDQRLFGGAVLADSTGEFLWVSAGDGTGAARIYRITP